MRWFKVITLFACAIIFNLQIIAHDTYNPASFYQHPDSTEQTDFLTELTYKETLNDSDANLNQVYAVESDVILKRDTTNHNWWYLLRNGKLNLADTTVEYPRFMKFCVNVYNWADRVFNSYDTEYVLGTGKRWKARLVSDNWMDSYAINFNRDMPIRIMSDIYCNAGAYVQYMAVSIGYTIDLSNIIGNKPSNHKKLEYGFNCARFNVEGHYWENTGGSVLRKFGKYNNGRLFRMEYPGINFKSIGVKAYYFFNNRKYSQGATYNFSKYQIKSAGSFIIGFSYDNMTSSLNLSNLPYKLRPFANISLEDYRIHYNSYCIMFGYGYNWVLNPHLLFNVSIFPEIGITKCYADSYQGNKTLRAMNFDAKASLTYNLGNFFVCLIGRMVGNWYYCNQLSYFSSIENGSASIGLRF